LGNGKITVENFLTIVCEEGLLIKLMDIPSTHVSPTLRVDGELIATGSGDYFGVTCNKILGVEMGNS
jgi:hypothetical protein